MPTFLDLPLPIREQIYRYALVMPRVFVRPFLSMEYLLDTNRVSNYGSPNLSLLRTSRQVYEEAMPIYLGENTFSIVQVDILAAARREFPRVRQNLKMVRSLEIVFDARDYVYMARFLSGGIPAVMEAVEDADGARLVDGRDARRAVQALGRMHACFDMPDLYRQDEDDEEDGCGDKHEEDRQLRHDQHIENVKEYLWGRTLTFVRQTFQLNSLFVDLRRCMCVDGCCRLAAEVMGWGWFGVWIHGMPREIEVMGTSDEENDIIAKILHAQQFHPGLRAEEIYDPGRVRQAVELDRYSELLRSVRQEFD